MITTICVGPVSFVTEDEFRFPIRGTDRQFIVPASAAAGSGAIPLRIGYCDSIEPEHGRAVWEQNGFSVFDRPEGIEVRDHRALWIGGQPLYAKSIRSKSGVEIRVRNDGNLLRHPNTDIWPLLFLEQYLLERNAFILHSVYLEYNGEAVLISAPSGTGKSTHAKLWERIYGAKIVNGDLGLVVNRGGSFFAEGYPYHGSAPECTNKTLPLRAVVMLSQAAENTVRSLTVFEKLRLLFAGATVNSWDAGSVGHLTDLLTGMTSAVPVVGLSCNMENDAARTLHRYLYGE